MAKLTTRDRALAAVIEIIERRATEIEGVLARWHERYPDDPIGAATERSAFLECKLISRLVAERMSPAGRAALSHEEKGG